MFFTGLRATLCGAIPGSRQYKPESRHKIKGHRYVQESRVYGHIPETCPIRGHIGLSLTHG
jgi:hypothetical protein